MKNVIYSFQTHKTFDNLQNTSKGILRDFCPSIESPFQQNF